MTGNQDSYEADGFRKVNPFSTGNVFVAMFLLLVAILIVLDVWLTPKSQVIDFEQEVVIPWKPHPPAP